MHPHFTCSETFRLLWFKIDQCIHLKLFSITYSYLASLLSAQYLLIQTHTCTRYSFTHHAPVLWNARPKEFRQSAIHSFLTLVNFTLLLHSLIYPHHTFTPGLQLISSTNHLLLSLFHALTSFLWLYDLFSRLPSHIHCRCITRIVYCSVCIMHMLVEAPLFFFGNQLSLSSHLPVLPSRLLNSLMSPSNFSILD